MIHTKQQFNKLPELVEKTRKEFYTKQKELRDATRNEVHHLEMLEADILDTKQQVVEAEDETYEVEKELNMVKKEYENNHIHEEDMRQQLHGLKVSK